ncbi:hypothetical protein JTB14_000170 [Gonioctena quinquepunctata]|nr:hypothetical protein JTB14_000170 [Gonioctena quinquepunctata]
MQVAGVSIPEDGAGIPELQQFQKHMNYKIIEYGSKGRNVIFEGDGVGPSLNLLHHERHYNVITSLTAAFCCIYYCEDCHVPYPSKEQHVPDADNRPLVPLQFL